MARRYLFGPVSTAFAEQNLDRARRAGECLTFNAEGTADVRIGPDDTWQSVCSRLPVDRQPEFIVLYLPYTSIAPCLWTAPVPLVGLAADWNLLWHQYRRVLHRCDLVLTDTAGVEVLRREGIQACRVANLFGCERDFLEIPQDRDRDIDILFVGNLHPAIQGERLPWLERLVRLGERWRVAIRTKVFGEAYRALLGRARIVFNRSIRGECNRRAFEAAAAGALLFQEAENLEIACYFRDRQECVLYTPDTLETLLTYYLEYEQERRTLAEAARARVCVLLRVIVGSTAGSDRGGVARLGGAGRSAKRSFRKRGSSDPLLADSGGRHSGRPDAGPGSACCAFPQPGAGRAPSRTGPGPRPGRAEGENTGCFRGAGSPELLRACPGE